MLDDPNLRTSTGLVGTMPVGIEFRWCAVEQGLDFVKRVSCFFFFSWCVCVRFKTLSLLKAL
jgi:hypothetical protein